MNRVRRALFILICVTGPCGAGAQAIEDPNDAVACIFLDARGQPMAGATVEIFASQMWEFRHGGAFAAIKLDGAGRLRAPAQRPTLEDCFMLVSDPNYGTAIVEPYSLVPLRRGEPLRSCVVPLAPVGTRADERSIWGTVVDSNDKGIADAVVKCREIRVPGGGSLKVYWPWEADGSKEAKVPTDAEGRFAMHLPLADNDGRLGRPVPPGSLYQVTIAPPSGLGYRPFQGQLAAGREHHVTLAGKPNDPKSFSGTLVFEDSLGPVSDPDKLKHVTIRIRPMDPNASPGSAVYSDGAWMAHKDLPFGIYQATAQWNGTRYAFEPVTITPESPASVVFKPVEIKPDETLDLQTSYRGRVVHAVTGEPVPQAIVMRNPRPLFGTLNLSLDPESIAALGRHFGPEINSDSQSLRAMEQRPVLGVTHTGPDGSYEIALPSTKETRRLENLDSIIAIKKDFLGAEQRLNSVFVQTNGSEQIDIRNYEPDATGVVPLPDMKLFPAGTLIIDPNDPREVLYRKSIRFYYTIDSGDPRAWVNDLRAAHRIDPLRGPAMFRADKLRPGEKQGIYVPADVTLTLNADLSDDLHAPAAVQGVRVEQGQVLDLGRLNFAPAMRVAVKVLDSAGNPLEGISIQRCDEAGHRLSVQPIVTDEKGIAIAYVPPNSRGQFTVEDSVNGRPGGIREGTAYQVRGHEDAGSQFVLQLSDSFLSRLRANKSGR